MRRSRTTVKLPHVRHRSQQRCAVPCLLILAVTVAAATVSRVFPARAEDAEDGSAAKQDWWSLQPIVRPATPSVAAEDTSWMRSPIDAFIAARLRKENLSPSREADRRTLIRRLTFDLHGLPPTPDDVQQFLADPA